MCFIRFINGNDSIYWRTWHKRLDIWHIYIYNKASKHIWFAYFSLFDYLLKKDLATGPYLIILWSDLYSKGRQLSPLEGSCFQHLYIALRGRVPRCRRVFVGASPRCQGWHHMGRPMGPYVDVPTTGVEYVRFEPCKCWLVLKAGQTDLSFPPFLFAISIATLGRKGQTQTPPAWSAFFPPLFWFFSVSLPKKIQPGRCFIIFGRWWEPFQFKTTSPPWSSPWKVRILHAGKPAAWRNTWKGPWKGLSMVNLAAAQGKNGRIQSNSTEVHWCIGALVCGADNSTRWSQRLPGF